VFSFQGTIPTSVERSKKIFTDDLERELAKHYQDMELRFYGLTRKQLEFAVLNGLSYRNLPGKMR